MASGPADSEPTSAYPPPLPDAKIQPAVMGPLSPSPATGASMRSPAPRVVLEEEGAPGVSSVTNPLRQSRLRAAALFLTVTAGVLLVVGLLRGDPLWLLHTSVTCFLVAACALLSRRRPIPLLPLRVLEAAIFGLMVVNVVVGQYAGMLHAAGEDDATQFQAGVKNALMGSIILMFAYTMLIPNSWRVAAAVVLVFAAAPVVTEGILFHQHPETLHFASQEKVFLLSGTNFLLALVAGSLAVYGTHILNTLRQEVFEARRLNQYQLRERLGSGGMGDVYLAEHRLLKRPCALKLIRPESAGDRKALARFEREVRSAARLSHPNIVDIYDYGHTQDGTFYYVMEYLSGLSLADLVERYGPLPPGRAIYLLRQACEALAEAHAAGLIHRDLKPANIFAAHIGRRNDVAKLLDFGLVKEVMGGSVQLTAPGLISGTPQFMAPEQATASKTLDHRADLYALGSVVYYLLTGHPPFERDSIVAVMIANVRDPVVPPAQLRPGLPADLEQVVLRCLAKDPADRYPDAETLGQALAACADADTWDARQAALWWQEVQSPAKSSPAS